VTIWRWIKGQFDETDAILVVGLLFLYFGLQSPAVPGWIPPTSVGAVLIFIACLGYWRGRGS
jgi:hypothetical protein